MGEVVAFPAPKPVESDNERRGRRALILGGYDPDAMTEDELHGLARDQVEMERMVLLLRERGQFD